MNRASMALGPLLLVACNVTVAETTGGADLPARGECPRGLALLSSDFGSSEVALLAPDGTVASPAFVSSASGAASNVAAPLSGDVTVAGAPYHPNEVVLVDRFGTNVLTFADAKTALVRAQLPIGTGFEANPQDYLEVSEHKAYVPRLGENGAPGREPFDAGSDLLVLDPSEPKLLASLPMPRQAGYRPSPAAVARVGSDVLVTLWHIRPDFSGMADGEIIALSSADDSERYRLRLTGLQNCGRAELSPSGQLLAVACTAFIDAKGSAPDVSTSGIVLLDASVDPPLELRRFAAQDLVSGPIQQSLEFVDEGRLLFKSQTAQGSEADNQLLSLDLASGHVNVLATAQRAAAGQGYGIAFGGMSCHAQCGDPCLVTDASRGTMLRFDVRAEQLVEASPITTGGAGLPPVGIAPFW